MKTSPWKKIKKCKYLYIMMLLPIIYYILFHYLPLYGVLIAFKDYKIAKGVWGSPWVGFKWFEKFLADPYFWKLVKNTLLLNIYGLLWGFPVPILLALMLNEVTNAKFKRAIQTVSYLPHFISTVVVCGMVMNFLSLDGIINQIIAAFGFDKIQFMVLPEWFRTIFTASGIWQTCGWTSIIYLSALTSVDQEILEAAMIDGANRFQRIIHVDQPAIVPTIITMLIFNCASIMNIGFDKVYLMQNDMNIDRAEVISTFVYKVGLTRGDFSFSTAAGLFQSLVSFILLVIVNKICKTVTETSLW